MDNKDLELCKKIIDDIEGTSNKTHIAGFATPSKKEEHNKFLFRTSVDYNEIFHLAIEEPMFKPGTIIGNENNMKYKDFFSPDTVEEECTAFSLKCESDWVDGHEFVGIENVRDLLDISESVTTYKARSLMILGETIQIRKVISVEESQSRNKTSKKITKTYFYKHYIHAMLDNKKININTNLFSSDNSTDRSENLDLKEIKNIYKSATPEEVIKPYVILGDGTKS